MKIKNIFLIILLLALTVSAGWRIYKNFLVISITQTKKDIYYCPMHPTYTSDHPGNCPICNMKLVKKENFVPENKVQSVEKKILYWTDHMMPGYKAQGPGKSPMGIHC